MSDPLSDKELEFSKWKVADLRKELKLRGLSIEGKKNELVERLQLAVGDSSILDDTGNDHDDILDEDVLTDEEALEDSDPTKSETPEKKEEKAKPVIAGVKREASKTNSNGKQAKKIVLNRNLVMVDKNATKAEEKENKNEVKEETAVTEKPTVVKVGSLTAQERLERRAAKFGVPMSNDAKKEARAARFGLPSASSKVGGIVNTNIDILKKRAERFGTTLPGSMLEKAEIEERRKKRELRFGKVEPTATKTASTIAATVTATKTAPKASSQPTSLEEKKRLRAERFKST